MANKKIEDQKQRLEALQEMQNIREKALQAELEAEKIALDIELSKIKAEKQNLELANKLQLEIEKHLENLKEGLKEVCEEVSTKLKEICKANGVNYFLGSGFEYNKAENDYHCNVKFEEESLTNLHKDTVAEIIALKKLQDELTTAIENDKIKATFSIAANAVKETIKETAALPENSWWKSVFNEIIRAINYVSPGLINTINEISPGFSEQYKSDTFELASKINKKLPILKYYQAHKDADDKKAKAAAESLRSPPTPPVSPSANHDKSEAPKPPSPAT